MDNHEFMEKAAAKLKETWDKLEAYDKATYAMPELRFDLRSRTCAGTGGRRLIRLNLAFVAKNGEEMISRTVPHEAVHSWLASKGDPSMTRSHNPVDYLAPRPEGGFRFRRARRSVHGHTFQFYMAHVLQADATRCHNYEAPEAADRGVRRCRRVTAVCPSGCELQISIQRANKMRRGVGYLCKRHHLHIKLA